jgi:predicted PurR-regulated permease PerM
MGLELEKGLKLFFQVFWSKTITHLSSCVFCVALLLLHWKKICDQLVCVFNDTKIAQFGYIMRRILKNVEW